MSRFFTINGRRYVAKPFDYNMVCDLEDNGVSLTDISKKPMSLARVYLAICMGGDKVKAGKEIQEHVIAGGDFNELYTIIGEEMNESGFFQALNKEQTEETPIVENEKKSK